MINYRPVVRLALSVAIVGSTVFWGTRAAGTAATSAQTYSGAEGSIGVNNTSGTGGALEGTVTSSGDTTQTMPFGIFGEYKDSATVFGVGIAGISTTGYGVGAEVLGGGPVFYALSTSSGDGLQAVADGNATGLALNSGQNAATIFASKNYGMQITSGSGTALEAVGIAGSFFASGGSVNLALANGEGVDAIGGDETSAKNPGLYAKANTTASDIFDGFNQNGEVFALGSSTANASGLAPTSGSDVSMQGDLYITGGIYECTTSGECTSLGASAPPVSDVRARDGSYVRAYGSQSLSSTLEDFGEGRMTNGSAVVRLDPAFAALANAASAYDVFLTPGGDSKGLYFTNRSPAGFEVHESGGGRSNLAFSYRIVATRSAAAPAAREIASSSIARTLSGGIVRRAALPQRVAPPVVVPRAFRDLLHRRASAVGAGQEATTASAQLVTGSEGAIAYNNTSANGSAIEGTVSPSGNTSESLPFGIFGEWNSSTANSATGMGAIGISSTGYGVAAEAFGSSVAVLGLNVADDSPGMQISATGSGTGVEIESAGTGLSAVTSGDPYDGIFVAGAGPYAVAATSTSGTAATFGPSSIGSTGQAVIGDPMGTGISATGYNNNSNQLYPALVAQAYEQSDIFDAYNSASSTAVLRILGTTADASGLAPNNGDDVSIYGDFKIHGGLFQCTTASPSTCTAVTAQSTSALQSEPTVEASGEARLTGGRALVALDPKFARTISIAAPYLVFLTPNGDTAGLYFSNRTPSGFEVRESGGGRSNATFSYRIVARPFGPQVARFPAATALRGPAPKPEISGVSPAYRTFALHKTTVHHLAGSHK
jgi:hypothetical protein